jgi:uncharacterized C2H2 Zn-finger protein
MNYFRKHGDPKFNENLKHKNQPQNEGQKSTEKRNEGTEMVNCDVCTEVFPTISKAITHKHKMHPDHDAKYFCPWCGKLFTMKVGGYPRDTAWYYLSNRAYCEPYSPPLTILK